MDGFQKFFLENDLCEKSEEKIYKNQDLLQKNWEGYFLNSYSVKVLASEWEKDKFTESKNFFTESQAAQAEVLPIWLYNDIYINTMSLILALLHQIESFHRLQIKPNKLDLSQEKLTLFGFEVAHSTKTTT